MRTASSGSCLDAAPGYVANPTVTWVTLAAEVYAERHRMDEALRLIRLPISYLAFGPGGAADAERLLSSARTTERAGDPTLAAELYGQLAEAWAGADSEFQSHRREIHAALARLAPDGSRREVPVRRWARSASCRA